MVSDLDHTVPLTSPDSVRPSDHQNPSELNTPSQLPTTTKKKKKRKNSSSASPPDQPPSSSSAQSPQVTSDPSSSHLSPATLDQWQQRVQNLRSALTKAHQENQLQAADLSAALARASDAEHAEDTVNKGLLTARSVISQRDRTIAELNSTLSVNRADLTRLTEEKKKTDKRLLLLKTVSANLQEAREARDNLERKLDDANDRISKLTTITQENDSQIANLEKQVDALEMVKQQLARVEHDFHELSGQNGQLQAQNRRSSICAAGAGSVAVFAVAVAMRIASAKSRHEKD